MVLTNMNTIFYVIIALMTTCETLSKSLNDFTVTDYQTQRDDIPIFSTLFSYPYSNLGITSLRETRPYLQSEEQTTGHSINENRPISNNPELNQNYYNYVNIYSSTETSTLPYDKRYIFSEASSIFNTPLISTVSLTESLRSFETQAPNSRNSISLKKDTNSYILQPLIKLNTRNTMPNWKYDSHMSKNMHNVISEPEEPDSHKRKSIQSDHADSSKFTKQTGPYLPLFSTRSPLLTRDKMFNPAVKAKQELQMFNKNVRSSETLGQKANLYSTRNKINKGQKLQNKVFNSNYLEDAYYQSEEFNEILEIDEEQPKFKERVVKNIESQVEENEYWAFDDNNSNQDYVAKSEIKNLPTSPPVAVIFARAYERLLSRYYH